MPDYYDGKKGIQPFDIIDAFGLDFYEGNVIKYICRWRKKDGIQDLRKARDYIDEIINRAEDAEQAAEDDWAEQHFWSVTKDCGLYKTG
jgi:methyl coenzyme M reductase subunit C-like uncharacterized protein (methanogenesis marker protein 7)